MTNTMIDTKEVILALQKVKNEKGLSLDKIHEMVEEQDPASAVSKTSIARVFRKGAETQIFKWENTLKPIANALLDIDEIEVSDDTNTQAFKSILKLKADLISELRNELKTVESEEKLKYHNKLEKERAQFKRSIEFLREQIALKDKRIDHLLNVNEKLADTNDRLSNRLLTCSCRKDNICQ